LKAIIADQELLAMFSPLPFHKYHALGNDYIVLKPDDLKEVLTVDLIRLICHRNYGIGSDGILYGPLIDAKGNFRLRIFNPDGSEAEKSGNGLRIFSRYLHDKGLIGYDSVRIMTAGGPVKARVHQNGKVVTVDMGKVSFDSRKITVTGAQRDVLNEAIEVDGQTFDYCAATIGNPHCVILRPEVSADETRKWGPIIERDPRFPHRTNVQFMEVMDRSNIRIEIWERGAGYTLASGSSSSASAAVARRLGLCDDHITVHMPGGRIDIKISQNFAVTMSGSVAKVAEGVIDPEMFQTRLAPPVS
jgi:diaminopimelate epimerase